MATSNGTPGISVDGLRERLPNKPDAPQKAKNSQAAQDAVKALNEQESKDGKDEKEQKTYGRTPNGTGMCATNTQTLLKPRMCAIGIQ